jgi:hypothetical protein
MLVRGMAYVAICVITVGSVCAQEQTFMVSNTTPNCTDASTVTHKVCLPAGKTIGNFTINMTSAAGSRHDIVSQAIAPGEPNCLQIVTAVAPNGEDCISIPLVKKVCNCKGRGWIELDVHLTPQ